MGKQVVLCVAHANFGWGSQRVELGTAVVPDDASRFERGHRHPALGTTLDARTSTTWLSAPPLASTRRQ